MSFSLTYRAIIEMVGDVALQTPTARGVARKAGLRRGSAPPITSVISDFLSVAEQPLARQYLVDLTGATRARFYSDAPIYLLRSGSLESAELDPGDYVSFLDDTFTPFSPDGVWRSVYSEYLTASRLTVSTSPYAVGLDTSLLSLPFVVLLQASFA